MGLGHRKKISRLRQALKPKKKQMTKDEQAEILLRIDEKQSPLHLCKMTKRRRYQLLTGIYKEECFWKELFKTAKIPSS